MPSDDSLGDKIKYALVCGLVLLGLFTPGTFIAGQHWGVKPTDSTELSKQYGRGVYDLCIGINEQQTPPPSQGESYDLCNKLSQSARDNAYSKPSPGYKP